MALLSTGTSGPGQTYVAVGCGGSVVVGGEDTSANVTNSGTTFLKQITIKDSPIDSLKFSPSGRYIGVCSEDKKVRVFETTDWTFKGERVIPRRGSAIAFTSDDKSLLVADKTGEVCQYSLEDFSLPGSPLLGHFSMLLDVVLSPCDSHVITCDRDEKIRVSRYPNSYNIETFCLGHKEYVTTLSLCNKHPHLLVSGSGDGTLRVWNWLEGRLLHTEVCSQCSDTNPSVVIQVSCCHGDTPIVVALLERYFEVLVYDLSFEGTLTPRSSGSLKLDLPPWSCSFDWSDRLWVCLPNKVEPLVCFKLINNQLKKCTSEENCLLLQLSKWEYFKDGVGQEKVFTYLRKQVFDNMSSYLARKEERIKEQAEKKTTRPPSSKDEPGHRPDKNSSKFHLSEGTASSSSSETHTCDKDSSTVMDSSLANIQDNNMSSGSVEQCDSVMSECVLDSDRQDIVSEHPPEKKIKTDYS